jgi:hypothetical protein
MYWRQLAVIILFFSVLLQSFNRAVIVGGYYAAAYAKACENKARPEMKCGGKCQMMKKLKNEEKNEQQAPSGNRFDLVISSKSFFATVTILTVLRTTHFTIHHSSIQSGYPQNLLRPPGCA